MATQQQQETLNYFDAFAKDWKEKAQGQKVFKVNVINQRNGYVLEVIKSRSRNSKTLDVGCGTGELVHETAKLGVQAEGVDFAPEMIKLAQEIATKENLSNATFNCASIFDFKMEDGSYDVISANGFLEYISYEQLDQFLETAHKALAKDGSIVLGSRNRLFNVMSMNEYASNEVANNNIGKLVNEAVQISNMNDLSDLLKIDAVPLEKPDATHGNTGIDVSTRFQFTPVQLAKMLDAKGFEIKGLCPVHIHGVSPAFKDGHKEAHFNISNLLSDVTNEDKASRNKVIPFASSFMIHATKK